MMWVLAVAVLKASSCWSRMLSKSINAGFTEFIKIQTVSGYLSVSFISSNAVNRRPSLKALKPKGRGKCFWTLVFVSVKAISLDVPATIDLS